jgi:hypothetical protein
MPPTAQVYESSMHGGWAEAPNGKMYTAIPNAGLYEISPGGTWTLLSSDTKLQKNVHAFHFFTHSSTEWLVAVQDVDHRVLFIDPSDGSIVDEVTNPIDTAHSFSTGTAYGDCNTYFSTSGEFNPTSAVYSTGNNKVYVANGYGGTGGQCIMRIYHDGSNWVWDDLAFGGYGDTGSDLKTPHGLAYFGGKLLVANMDSKRITRFNDDGSYVSGGDFSGLPSGVRPSAISTIAGESDMLVITSYDRTVGSTVTYPIYFYKPSTDTVESTVSPAQGEDIDISGLFTSHHAHPHKYNDGGGERMYLWLHGPNWRVLQEVFSAPPTLHPTHAPTHHPTKPPTYAPTMKP